MSSAAACVAPHLRCLRAAGFCRAPRRLHGAYRAAVLAVTGTYLLQECVYAYQNRSDMEELARVMFLLLCHVTSLAKQVVFAGNASRVEALVASLARAGADGADGAGVAGGAAGAARAAAAALGARTRRRAARLQAWFAGAAMLTCTLWLVFPLAARLQQHRVTFPFWLPGDAYAPPRFAAALFYQFYVTSLVGIANTTMDAFIATVLYQCQTQLHILRLNFKSVVERAEEIQSQTKEDLEDVALRLFKDCVNHYHRIIETANLLQEIFGLAILINFGIGGWILCMAVYKLVSISMLSIEFLSMLMFICCILFELFLYCYYGNEVTVESARLAEGVAASAWRGGRRRRLARAVLLTLLRAGRPLRPAATRLVPLTLHTFLKILKSSYTFYAVLRQTKDT